MASRRRRHKEKPEDTPTVAETPPAAPQEATGETEEFIKNNHRKQTLKRNTAKRLRFVDEIKFVNKFTEMYINSKIPKEDIKILADVKAFLLQMDGNPYNLKAGEANAMICSDLKHLCIDGEVIDDARVKLEAKEVSANRVAYWNPVLAQQIINATDDDEQKATMTERMDVLRNLPHRTGYGLD